MAEKSIIIIGAGIAGLATGSYGQMNGYRTRIVEHHSEPGGVAKAWKHSGYLIDGGIHYLMGHRPGPACHEIYRELGILHKRHFPDLETFVHFADEITGRSVDFTGDLEKLARDLKVIAPEDARFVDRFIGGIGAFQRTDIFGTLEKPPELMGPTDFIKQFWALRRVLPYFGGPFNQPMEKFVAGIQNEGLRRIVVNLFLPEVPVWFVLLILSLLANRQMGLLEGSCKDFVESMEDRYKKLGGEVQYNATVKEIIVENNRAVGVRLVDGGEQRADVVVAAGDGYSTLFKLLGDRYTSKKLKDCYQNWQHLVPIVTLSFGVGQEYPGITPLNFLLLKKPMTIGNITITGFPVRIFNYGTKGFSPPGKTIVQALLHSDWDFWEKLLQDRPAYEAEKKRVCAETLERLEAHHPGITAKVEMTDIATPYTTWRYTLNHKGAFMGWVPTPKALRTLLPKTLPGLENFYMAGQWIMPGGGVPPCLYSGRHVIQILCKRDQKKFATSVA